MMKEVERKLFNILSNILDVKSFDVNISMENNSNWDSLKHVQILSAIEKNFGIEIKFKDSISFVNLVIFFKTIYPN